MLWVRPAYVTRWKPDLHMAHSLRCTVRTLVCIGMAFRLSDAVKIFIPAGAKELIYAPYVDGEHAPPMGPRAFSA